LGSVTLSVFPDFAEMIRYCKSRSLNPSIFDTPKSKIVTRGYPVEIYIELLRFLRLTLVIKANEEDMVIDDHLEDRVEDGMSEDPVMRERFGAKTVLSELPWKGTWRSSKTASRATLRI